ncbi:MAG: substrate-binding domain-containing protein [Thermacetogeniaceae bacterium]|jgi:tungstate transport system substrate-binding protein
MKKNSLWLCGLVVLLLLGLAAGCAKKQAQAPQTPSPQNKTVILSSTTDVRDTGLMDALIPVFESQTGYNVKPIYNGSGQAIALGEKGEADVLITHAPSAEKPDVDNGAFINYQLLMHNSYVIVGPPDDPAKIKGLSSTDAFKKIAKAKAVFVSRADNSGTNIEENVIWKQAGITPSGNWYIKSGQGMGPTLLIASEKTGYTLTDLSTYLAQQKNIQLDILVQGDKSLINIYHVMQVNPAKFSKVNADGAKAFEDFMVSQAAQNVIADFGKDKYGQPLYYADAGKSGS